MQHIIKVAAATFWHIWFTHFVHQVNSTKKRNNQTVATLGSNNSELENLQTETQFHSGTHII